MPLLRHISVMPAGHHILPFPSDRCIQKTPGALHMSTPPTRTNARIAARPLPASVCGAGRCTYWVLAEGTAYPPLLSGSSASSWRRESKYNPHVSIVCNHSASQHAFTSHKWSGISENPFLSGLPIAPTGVSRLVAATIFM